MNLSSELLNLVIILMSVKSGDNMSFTYKNTKNFLFLFIGFLLIIASIIPKGSWSYFNDVETIPKSFSAATVNLDVKSDPNFVLKNMYPDKEEKTPFNISIKNNGTAPINDLYLDTSYDALAYNGESKKEADEFASQFEVEFLSNNKPLTEKRWTLKELAHHSPNIAKWLNDGSLNVGEQMYMTVNFTFIEEEDEQTIFEEKALPVKFKVEGIVGNNSRE